jgi:hypothetical protein
MKNTNLRQFTCSILLVMFLVGCSSSSAATNIRAGDWDATSSIGTLTITVNETGTAITQATVKYQCKSGAVSLSESATLNGPDNGWPIKSNRFSIDMLSSAHIKIQGKFNSDNTTLTVSLTARSCSSNWESTR